eukprot:16535-Heterococcus_DN1.PRE.2
MEQGSMSATISACVHAMFHDAVNTPTKRIRQFRHAPFRARFGECPRLKCEKLLSPRATALFLEFLLPEGLAKQLALHQHSQLVRSSENKALRPALALLQPQLASCVDFENIEIRCVFFSCLASEMLTGSLATALMTCAGAWLQEGYGSSSSGGSSMLSLPVLLQLVAVPALLLFFPELRASSSVHLKPAASAGSHKTEVHATEHSSVIKKHAAQQPAAQVHPAAATVIESLKELAAAAAAAVLQQLKHSMAHHARTMQDVLPQPVRELALKLQQKPVEANGREAVASQHSHAEHQRYFDELERTKLIAADVIESPGWSEVLQRDGVTVHKKYLDKDAYGSAFACVKATAVVDASPATLMQLLLDSTRVLEYNRYSKGRTDIAKLDANTKIVWNKTKPPLTSKLHDFCTLMHVSRTHDCSSNSSSSSSSGDTSADSSSDADSDDCGYVITTTRTEHPGAPQLQNSVRSEIVLGVTTITPHGSSSSRVTTVNHIVSAGVPAVIADRVSTRNAVDFIVNVSQAARGITSTTAIAADDIDNDSSAAA